MSTTWEPNSQVAVQIGKKRHRRLQQKTLSMHTNQSDIPDSTPVRLDIKAATFDDLKMAFRAGLRDLCKRPGLSLFFGLVYALFGGFLVAGLTVFDQIWVVVAAGLGFPLVAPFLAAGCYEMSRRLQNDEAFSAMDIFSVIFLQQRREFGWMSFIVLFVFWVWAYQVRLIFALTLHSQGYSSLESFAVILFSTTDGLTFLMIGTIVGAAAATVLYSITVISMPLLLDKDVDSVTAMINSVKTVQKSPFVMLIWGAIIGALTFIAILPFFLGIIIIFPILGHTTWHLYARLISER